MRKDSSYGARIRPVFVAKPSHMTYAEAMNRLRIWLDYKKIEPVGFKITANGPIGFEVSFSSERDAAEFELFGWPST